MRGSGAGAMVLIFAGYPTSRRPALNFLKLKTAMIISEILLITVAYDLMVSRQFNALNHSLSYSNISVCVYGIFTTPWNMEITRNRIFASRKILYKVE